MKKLYSLFIFLLVLVSIVPFSAAAASDKTIGKIQIYTSEDACLLLNNKKLSVQGRELYDTSGKYIGAMDSIGSSGRKVYIVVDGAYTVLNSPFVEVQYLKVDGTSYINDGDRIKLEEIDIHTKCVYVGKYDSKNVTVQALTQDQTLVLENLSKTQNAQNAVNHILTSLTTEGMFSEKKLNSRTFYILETGIELALDYSWVFQIACVLMLVLFFIVQFFLCVKIKKLFIIQLLPFLCTCGCAMTAVSYLMDYYGTYGAKAPGLATGLVFWQRVITSMGNGCLFGLIAAIVYQLVRSILKKLHAPKTEKKPSDE